jgi:hypothetical protein
MRFLPLWSKLEALAETCAEVFLIELVRPSPSGGRPFNGRRIRCVVDGGGAGSSLLRLTKAELRELLAPEKMDSVSPWFSLCSRSELCEFDDMPL